MARWRVQVSMRATQHSTNAVCGDPGDGVRNPAPRVTVVIPTHNRADVMPATLHSVLRQRGVDLRVVIVDDGSSDETADVLRSITDQRVRWIRKEPAGGVSNARNAGLDLVDTPWVAFTDDDDLWAPDKLARQLASLRANPEARWACVGSVVVDSQLKILRHERPPKVADLAGHLLRNNCIPAGGSGVLASTRLVREVGGFDPQLSNLADWDMWIRLSLAAPATAVGDPLVAYVVQPNGMAHGVARTIEELASIGTKYAAERARRNVTMDWGTWHRYLARLQLRVGNQRAAATSYFRAGRAGQWTRYAVGVMCLVVPGLSAWADRRGRLRVPPRWAHEANAWLRDLRDDYSTAVPPAKPRSCPTTATLLPPENPAPSPRWAS